MSMAFIPDEYKKYAPSKRIAIPLLILLLVGGALIVFKKVTPEIFSTNNSSVQAVSFNKLAEKDTDSDGLPDWEEQLWGTSAHKWDSRGDGMSDGDYVNTKKQQLLSSNPGIQNSDNKLTQTQLFSRDLYIAIASLQSTGNLNDKNYEQIAAMMSEYIENAPQGKQYQLSDLNVVPVTSETVTAYNIGLTNAFRKNTISKDDPMAIIANITDRGTAPIEKFADIQESYDNLIKALLSVSVPEEAVSVQLSIINSLQSLSGNLENLQKIHTDPIVALSATFLYGENLEKLSVSLQQLQKIIVTLKNKFE